jgi:hypothetical protein
MPTETGQRYPVDTAQREGRTVVMGGEALFTEASRDPA